ncbi:hypothetical protein PCYB_031460 [Plasmodium cynomolgi strain B]|uniref:Uncharacterized protein n=1 Tax=Plasmodium cynomolgi (strain B) TaxID=1120755 RepID=K6UI68_PLACD|nr:hypothetical protein PCYB_031460 [Plasmodium cynomolgi strain B]GAB64733.1 hypothetical protein PCYB_031460 [Plasmodium cynomolgi strain B]
MKKEILEDAFTNLEENPTATKDKKFASFLPSCGGIERVSEGGERKSIHKGSNKSNIDTKEANRENKELGCCNDLANGKIEVAASVQSTDGDKSKCTNEGDLTKYASKIWCSKKCANVPKLDLGLALTLPNRGEYLRKMIDKRGVAKNGKVGRKKKEGKRINLNKNNDHLERDASELSKGTLPCDEKRSHVSIQIGGASRLGHSSLNEERKKGNLPPDEPELDSSETDTSLSRELKKDSQMSRKRICKSSTILSPRKRLGRNQKSSEKIAHERSTSDSSNGPERRRMFIEHSRRKTVYNGEPKKKRLGKNKAKLKKCSMDSFDTGKGHNFTREKGKVDGEKEKVHREKGKVDREKGKVDREKEKVDREKEKVELEKWENKSNSGRLGGDSSEGGILERKKKKGKLPLPKGSEQFECYVNSRGNKTKAAKYQGGKVTSVESSKYDTDESSSSADLRPNYEGHHVHGSKKEDEQVLEERPLGMSKLSKKRFHFCKEEGDEEKLKLCEKHHSVEKVEYDQKGEYFFSDKCREMHANMAEENLKNCVSPDMMSKRILGGEQDHQYTRKGEGSNEDYSYVSLEKVSKNGEHNFYFRKSRYTNLRGKLIRLSSVGDGGEVHNEADLSNSVRYSQIGYFSGGEHYSDFSEVGEHYDGRNDDKYRFPFFDEMYEGGKFAGEVDLPGGDSSVLEKGNPSGSVSGRGSGKGELYLAFQESAHREEKSLPDESLHSKPPLSNVERELNDDAHLRRLEYVRGQICRILKKENWDGEAESVLNLFFRYVKLEGRFGKNDHTLIGKDIKRDKMADLGRGENGGVDKLKRVYLDDAPKSLPLTMLIVRNYEEGHLHQQQQWKERNEKVSVRYKVELTGVKNPMGIKKAIEKEKKLFSRIERIYDFCALDGEVCGEQYDNNIVDRFIPFPNMGWSCSKDGYQEKVVSDHSAWAQERKRVFFDDEQEKLINSDRSHVGGKGLMIDDALLGVPKKGGTNNANKFEKKSPLAKWNVKVYTKSIKQPGGKKNALLKKGPKGAPIHFDRKGSLKHHFRKGGVPVVGGKAEGNAIRIGMSKKSPLPRKSALEGSYPKSKVVKWGKGHHVTNFKEYLTKMRNPQGGDKTKEPFPKGGQKREDLRDTQRRSPLSSSILKIVDDKNDEKIITKSFFLPRGGEPEVVKREIWNRSKGELGSYRKLKSSVGHVFKRGGSKRDEDFKRVSEPSRDVLDTQGSAHNGSQKSHHEAVERKEKVGFYKSKNFGGKKEHKEGGNKKGASNTFGDSYAGKNNRDGDHPRSGSFKTDRQNCKAIEKGPQSLDEGGSSGKPPRREEEPSSNEKEEGTKKLHAEGKSEEGAKKLHAEGKSEEGLSSTSKDEKRKKEEKASYNSRRSEGMVDKAHPSAIERFYKLSKRSKVGKKGAEGGGLEQEAEGGDLENKAEGGDLEHKAEGGDLEHKSDTLKKEGSPRKLLRPIEVALPRKNSLRQKGALTGGRSISHIVSKHGKEKKQNCDLDPSAENKIGRGKDEKGNTAKGFSKKDEFYDFTKLGKKVKENISPLMVAEEERGPLKSHQGKGRSPLSVSNKNEIRLTASPHEASHMFNAPRKEGTQKGNNAKQTTNLVGRQKSSRIGLGGKPSPRAMGSFPHKMTQSQMDKPVLKNEEGMARNSNYVDLRHIECSKSTLEFFLEKKYLKRNSPERGARVVQTVCDEKTKKCKKNFKQEERKSEGSTRNRSVLKSELD